MKHLFKYVSSPHELLSKGYIRATQLSALNDPFEAYYCKNGLKELSDDLSDFDPDSPLSDTNILNYIDMSKYRIGIISLTEAKDNLLMWAHYANEHKGMVIGFSIFDKSFKQECPFSAFAPCRVINIYR